MIISNQVECLKCGDKPFSSHVHDFKYCKCGNVAVDGGGQYLRRVFTTQDFKDISLEYEQTLIDASIKAVEWGEETGRNPRGIVYAIFRAIRDSGYKVVKE